MGIALFTHAPPEHVAHVINATCLYAGLRRLGVSAGWVTMNPRDPTPILHPASSLSALGLQEFASECATEVPNCAPCVPDETRPEPAALRRLLRASNSRCVYLHYYPPFWGPVVEACRAEGIRVGLHVQSFSRHPTDPPFFLGYPGASDAIQKADFLTVSQQADVAPVCALAKKSPKDVGVLPKAVPPGALARAAAVAKSKRAYEEPSDGVSGVRVITYIGRLERFKNISWFLERCLPDLADREDAFRVLIVGRGTVEKEVASLARRFSNVQVILQRLVYSEALALVARSDLILFPSGYDYSPRLPLEAILLGIPVLMGRFTFTQRYHGAAGWLVDASGTASDVLEYSGQSIDYGLPDVGQTVTAVRQFLDRQNHSLIDREVLESLTRESAPTFGAARLLRLARLGTEEAEQEP